MNDYYSWNKILCRELCCEMEKFEHEPTPEILHNVKKLAETMVYMQELEAADAMRDYFEDEHGYDSRSGDFDKRLWDYPAGVYNAAGGRRRNSRGRYMSAIKPVVHTTTGRDKKYMPDGNSYDDMQYNRNYPMMADDDYRMDNDRMTYMRGVYNHADPSKMKHEEKLTEEEMKKWVESLENSDGTKGETFTMDEAKAIAKKVGATYKNYTEMDFWVVLNSVYSDYSESLKRAGAASESPTTYGQIALAWLEDDDSYEPDEKLYRYYTEIVKH